MVAKSKHQGDQNWTPIPRLRGSILHADSQPRKPPTRVHKERGDSAASIIRSFVRCELKKIGHPLTRSEILERLDRAGIKIDAKVPIKRIAKVMWSSPEFINVGDGYWIAGESVPDGEGGTSD